MRRYDILTGILLILSIIDFDLAAPVLGQGKPQASVDVPNIPKSMTTVLGKRWEEDLGKLGEEYFKTSGKSIDSPGTHSLSGPAPNLASSTANPAPSMEPSCSASCSSSTGLSARGNCFVCLRLLGQFTTDLIDTYHDDLELLLRPQRPQPAYSTTSLETSTEYSSDEPDDLSLVPMYARPRPHPNLRPPIDPSADPGFDSDLDHSNAEGPPPFDSLQFKPVPPKEGLGDSEGVGLVGFPSPSWGGGSLKLGPSKQGFEKGQSSGSAPGPPPTEFPSYPGSVIHSPSPTEPAYEASSGPTPNPVDPPVAVDGVKGKAKEPDSISETAMDGNGAEMDSELQPAQRSLDPRE